MITRDILKLLLKTRNNLQTALGTIVSILVWLTIYFIGNAIFTIASETKGTNDWLEALCREALFSGIGGYYAFVALKKWMPKANLKFVFWAFCSVIFIFLIGIQIAGSLYCILSDECMFSWGEKIITCLAGVTAIFGAKISRAIRT